jgi:polyhydroxybutyrate depolymerase
MLMRTRSRTALLATACLTLFAGCSATNGNAGGGGAPSMGGAPSAGAAGAGNASGALNGLAGSNALGSAGAASGGAGAAGSSTGGAGNAGATAGSSGSAGTGGSSGAGAGGSAGASMMPSTGCGKTAPAAFTPEMYIRTNVPEVAKTPKGAVRVYELRLPKDYQPMKPYPLIFEDHGCDGSIPFHIEKATGSDAIIVALRAASNQDNNYMGGCFATGPNDSELTEVPYFDAVVSQIETALCVDKSKLFMEGYSSGSWLTNLLGCVRAGVLRGQGNATGGLPTVPMCAGPIAAMLAHDDTDDQNVIAEGMKARDRIKAINGCSDMTMPYEWDTNATTVSTCVQYQGCKPGFPLVWCPTHGKGHSDQVPISTTGFWKFWSALP